MRPMPAAAAAALFLYACAHPTVAPTAAAAPSAVREATFHSRALGVDKRFLVWLPRGYDEAAARRYPVIYMLHGLGGNERNWVEQGHLDSAAAAMDLQAIVVMPDGDAGFYADSVSPVDQAACRSAPELPFVGHERRAEFCVANASYETYIVADLIPLIDATYRTIADRRGRAIGGLSMGGFGALSLALRHRDLFSSVASHSGIDALLYGGPRPYVRGGAILIADVSRWGPRGGSIGQQVRSIFGPDIGNWRAHDPAALVQTLRPGELALYLDCGTEDGFGLDAGAAYLHDLLDARGIGHTFALVPGDHSFALWKERIGISLRFHAQALGAGAN